MPSFFSYSTPTLRKRFNKSARLSTIPKTMDSEIDKLVATVSDPAERKGFEMEMFSFKQMFSRYIFRTKQGTIKVDWDKISSLLPDQLISYEKLARPTDSTSLSKLAVLKLSGGLGTSMGIHGAKSALEVKDGQTFVDLTIQQIQHLNKAMRTDIPLVIMTSFKTQYDTIKVIKRYINDPVRILTFNQSRFPRFFRDTMLPCPKTAEDESRTWYPPGHGDLFLSLSRSGVLEQLLSEGKEYLFVSNSENLGATVDPTILQYLIESESEFLMEITVKTRNDLQSGTLVNYDGSLQLLELNQVPSEHVENFKSVFNFRTLNTNNLWINLKALKRISDNEGLDLDIMEKLRHLDNGRVVVQLETAAGSAIKHFRKACGIIVPRGRFLPVKNSADLLLVRSDFYQLDDGCLRPNVHRPFQTPPTIKLSEDFRSVDELEARFKTVPSMLELDHLTVAGDVYFGRACDLRGTVIVAATERQRIDIPDGSMLENKLLSGNLNLIEL
ncbi:UTP-glucose-1-phosphate uridylyltransferase [Lentinula raphanica]|nr:UTP-glucose-1-phosphate uridylyltransferase [Lentinula raphanica]